MWLYVEKENLEAYKQLLDAVVSLFDIKECKDHIFCVPYTLNHISSLEFEFHLYGIHAEGGPRISLRTYYGLRNLAALIRYTDNAFPNEYLIPECLEGPELLEWSKNVRF